MRRCSWEEKLKISRFLYNNIADYIGSKRGIKRLQIV